MNGEDPELEQLKAKRLAEMQKNIMSHERTDTSTDAPEKKPASPRNIVISKLGYRGLEVLENAESQFPTESKIILKKLAEIIESGELSEVLDGGNLLFLFRTVGLNVKMKTKINVEQDGKFVSLSDKLGSNVGNSK